ncbi:MAG TPA: hypothetical protein VG142_10660 [Trebonia sp.]|nr:hypothetical protein [Trebonia sp.]
MASVTWNAELAAVCDDVYAREAEPSVTTQDEQLAVFSNAAAHLGPAGPPDARAARVFFFAGVSPRR